ncbi:MAG: hypothetical protein IT458_05550 [Planctomycetes bacterium]|nr:hypothetical protein [Planctomycetota bacterium]
MSAADKNEKEPQAPAPAAKKKGGLKTLVLVAVGAALSGAGVVYFLPNAAKQPANHGPVEPEMELVELPDKFDFVFNARAERGTKSAKVTFLIVLRQDKKDAARVAEAVRANFNRAYSRALVVLKGQTAASLLEDEEIRKLTVILCRELSETLFPGWDAMRPEHRPRVDDLLWLQIYVQ